MAQNEDAASLRSEVVKHLSREIETHSQYLTVFRSRIAFTVLVGPFVILGYLLVTSKPTGASHWDHLQTWLCVAVGVLYLALGFCGSRLDQHGTDQCNKWRRAILKISEGNDVDEKDILISDPLLWPYMATFSVILLVAFFAGWLLLTLLPRG